MNDSTASAVPAATASDDSQVPAGAPRSRAPKLPPGATFLPTQKATMRGGKVRVRSFVAHNDDDAVRRELAAQGLTRAQVKKQMRARPRVAPVAGNV